MIPRLHRFADCSIDLATRELRRFGERVPLSPTVFDCLAYMMEHRDRAVAQDELIAAVLGKVDVGDSVIRQIIYRLRTAVGDNGSEQRVLRTITGFGYHFVAQVESDAAPASAEPVPVAAERPAEPGRGRRVGGWLAVAGLALLVVATAASMFALSGRGRDQAPMPIVDAVVLPVETTASDQWTWVRFGMMDLITSRLHAGGLTTISTESVVALARDQPAAGMTAALRELAPARYLVVPTAVHTEREWIVRLHLDAVDGHHRDVEVRDADVAAASRIAVDQLLGLLGRRPPAQLAVQAPLDELVARIRAAVFIQDLNTARELVEAAPAVLRQSPQLRYSEASLEYAAGHLETAYRLFEALAGDVGAESDPVLRGRLLNGLGLISTDLGEPARALGYLDESIDLLAGQAEPGLLGNTYNSRGIAHTMLGRYDEADADYAHARLALDIAGDTRLQAKLDLNEGILALNRDQPAAALPMLERGAQRSERLGDLTSVALAMAYLAEAHLMLLDPAQALSTYDAATLKLGRLHDPVTRNNLDYVGALALHANGRLAEARAKLDALSQAQGADPANGNSLPGFARTQQAKFELGMGRPKSALSYAREGVEKIVFPADARVRADAWLTLSRALRASGDMAGAQAEVRRFSIWADELDNPVVTLHARLAAAEETWGRSRAEARALYEDALRLAVGEGVPIHIALIANAYGGALMDEGDLVKASAVIGQVTRWGEHDFGCALLLTRFYRALGQHDAWQKALKRALTLAGERPIPAAYATAPDDAPLAGFR